MSKQIEIQTWIIEWFIRNTIADKNDIMQGLELNFFDSGWLDSMGFITFLADMESQFRVEFDNDTLQNDEFFTINGLVNILGRLI